MTIAIESNRAARCLPVGGQGGRADKARDAAHVAPQLRDASIGERNRHSDHPGSAWPQQSVVDGALHAGRDPYDPRDPKSVRSPDPGSGAVWLSPWPGGGPGVYLEVGDVLRRHGDALSFGPCRAFRSRRAARDGRYCGLSHRRARRSRRACDDCGVARVAYNSCRNRHCPKCPGRGADAVTAARQAELLPVPYFRMVFTLPAPVGAVAFQNKAAVYAILFAAAAEAMTDARRVPRRLERPDRRRRSPAHMRG